VPSSPSEQASGNKTNGIKTGMSRRDVMD